MTFQLAPQGAVPAQADPTTGAPQVGASLFGPQAFLALTDPNAFAQQAAEAGLGPMQILDFFKVASGGPTPGSPGSGSEKSEQGRDRNAFLQALQALQPILNPETAPPAPAVRPAVGAGVQGFDPRTIQRLLTGRGPQPGVPNLGSLIRG